jgi:hypothetical protein
VQGEDTNTGVFFPAADTVAVATGGSERVRVDSSGNVGIGMASPATKLDVEQSTTSVLAQFKNTSSAAQNGNINAVNDAGTALRMQVFGSAAGSYGMLSAGSPALYTSASELNFAADNASGVIKFSTGSSVPERARIDSSGNLLVAKTGSSTASVGCELRAAGIGTFTASSNVGIVVNRNTSDGSLVEFRQADTTEGTISVSGTTVSYNGGHLSRWAQFPDNSRPELLKGTVMSNLDQMSNWDGEDNEQLNCVEVSAVEGDANVAGVFVAWDSTEDDYNDILLAMTGDMVIRIAGGTTVQRGDLLMSAGDGTAKPQGDDIVRSKTIAKVTSTHVSHTYADGSYAVPCVLMAC